ncbi:elongation of very long chain fatty acids protein 7-like [Vanessa cardui]|uniref:elongation of very long chain fatty acids protein 7-like n=1 Tax=Vanessa cardui TaxID=171605 RepID=UPI001F1295F6|nr:elongation of very long chain fatty acids protein 7-like [Vanessa cardui]
MDENLTLDNVTMENMWKYNGELNYVSQWMLMNTPIPLIIITITYLLFVIKIGPKFMKNRPPFGLSNVLLIYNAVQVAYALYLCYQGSRLIWQNGLIGKSCLMETQESRYIITSNTYSYFFAKVTELLDTVFFVLRKKDNQVTFLHVYHHLTIMWCTWFNLKYEPSYSTIFLGTLNSYVHVIMYTYYGLSTFPELAKKLWWKKYITSLQLIQFVLMLLQSAASAIFPGCPPSYTLMIMIYINASLFIYLFGKFYIKSYLNSKDAKCNIKTDVNRCYIDKIK